MPGSFPMSEDRLREVAAAWGVVTEFWDVLGHCHRPSAETCQRMLAAMGCDPERPEPPPPSPVVIVRPGHEPPSLGSGELTLEDGAKQSIQGRLPDNLPIGYHEFRPNDIDVRSLVIVRPESCLAPAGKAWGWGVQLYCARSERSWGMGDFGDLERLARWSARQGAGLMLLNPLGFASPQQPSPYYPSSRCFGNPLYLDVPAAAKALGSNVDLSSWQTVGEALNAKAEIDRPAIHQLKREALERIWAGLADHAELDRYVARQGAPLARFGAYCALAEQFGEDWRAWPAPYHKPDSPDVAQFAQEQAERVRFHQWLQWLLDQQFARAAGALPMIHDLPIGIDPGGVDAWLWQDSLALGMTVGAPPDLFNMQGQNWMLPPFAPHKLRAAGYRPLIDTFRAILRHGGGIRIDHVMGLFRLYWIPEGYSADAGAYVRYPADELLAILAVESHRAGAWVAGEDLGTVEPGVRERLAEENILTHKILWFEDEPPSRYPYKTLAAITTHDLATVAGLWSGADLAALRRIGSTPDERSYQQMRERIRSAAGVADDAPVEEVVIAAHRALAQADSAVIIASLADGLAIEDRINMPGTIDEWPNWSIALPMPLERLEHEPLPWRVAEALRRSS